MSNTQLGHQVFHGVMNTPVPDLSSIGVNVQALFQQWAPQIQNALQNEINLGNFIANGFRSVQSVQVQNLTFPIVGGWLKIEFDIDILTDIDWIQVTQLIGVIGGISLAVLGVLTGQLELTALGILVTLATLAFVVYEVIHEIITTTGPVGTYLALIGLVGAVGVAGYFLLFGTRHLFERKR